MGEARTCMPNSCIGAGDPPIALRTATGENGIVEIFNNS
jgi:hypothetical protein